MASTQSDNEPSSSKGTSKLALACEFVVAIFCACAIAGMIPQVNDLAEEPVAGTRETPHLKSPLMWFGTDVQGRSVLLRMIVGSKTALAVSVGGASIAVGVGYVLGCIAGYYRGWVDACIIWLCSTFAAVPWVLLVALVALGLRRLQAFGVYIPALFVVILSLGITDWVATCRAVRAEVMRIRELDYVLAARALGARECAILGTHVLPNCFPIAAAIWGASAAIYVQSEVALTFMGIGISDQPSWGRMIDDSRVDIIRGHWWQFVLATMCVVAYSFAVNIVAARWSDSRRRIGLMRR